jgi:hypothetical protein
MNHSRRPVFTNCGNTSLAQITLNFLKRNEESLTGSQGSSSGIGSDLIFSFQLGQNAVFLEMFMIVFVQNGGYDLFIFSIQRFRLSSNAK